MLRGEFICFESSLITGIALSIWSLSDTGFAPGLEDSGPMSIIAAPSFAICRPCFIAVAGSRNCRPSLKESGVTLRIPIRRQPFEKSSVWFLNFSISLIDCHLKAQCG